MPCADSNTICARRHVTTDPVPLRTIRSNKVSGTRALGEGRHDVTFADGSTVVTSLLVGADGAWSRVRPLLSDATPEYVGTSFVETNLFDADTRHPAAAKAVGGGSMIAPAPGKEIFAHRGSGDTLHAYVALSKPQDWFAAIDFTDAAAATARVAAEFDGWAPELTAPTRANRRLTPRPGGQLLGRWLDALTARRNPSLLTWKVAVQVKNRGAFGMAWYAAADS